MPHGINKLWSMHLIHDQLEDGGTFRPLIVIDDFKREAIVMKINISFPPDRVFRELKQIISRQGKLEVIRFDNGPQYISAPIQTTEQVMGGMVLNTLNLKTRAKNVYV